MMRQFRLMVVMAIALALAGGAARAAEKKKTAPRRVDPAMIEITDDPRLPRVLLIGDSISIGYTPAVRKLLAGKANVHRPLANCGSTSVGLLNMEKWLGGGKWDVIHVNFGLHDLSYIYPATGAQQDAQGRFATLGTGRHKVPPVLYEANLRALVARLKKTGARLIWCTTTPVSATARVYVKGDDVEYNAIATRVMTESGIEIDDLGGFARPQVEKIQLPENVHFTAEGSAVLAGQVVKTIEAALAKTEKKEATLADGPDFAAMIRPVPAGAMFHDPDYNVWCGAPVRGDDGKIHLFYSRWPRKLGHQAWVTHSEVAHAVADSLFGPYKFADVALPARGKEFWDGLCTHNPMAVRIKGKYYIYYMGNTGDGVAMKTLNWTHRNNQRIGVAVADRPEGPWTRLDKPVLSVSADAGAPDALMVSNPAACERPGGGVLMVYKAVAKQQPLPGGGPVVHLVATSDSPTGPFKKMLTPIFTKPGLRFAAEDPYIWWDGDRYRAIVKDNAGYFTGQGYSLAQFESQDGLDWQPSPHVMVTSYQLVRWADGQSHPLTALERPFLYRENGKPLALFCAAADRKDRDDSFNIQIPLEAK